MRRRVVPRPLLASGQAVGIVTPGFGVRAADLRRGTAKLRELGYRVVLGRHVLDRDGYLAGDDEARAADLNAMIDAPDVRAIWFARGGYGSARLIERVKWEGLARDPKTLIGYSDATALFAVALEQTRSLCLYGPVVSELGEPKAYDRSSLRRLLAGERIALRFPRRRVLRAGRARGRLVGGNLTVLVHLLGTPHALDSREAILFLEDVGEPAYRLDRMLHQLRTSGTIDRVAGVVIGSFTPATRRHFLRDRPVADLLRETFLALGVPVITGLAAGHLPGKRTLPLGGLARLDTGAGTLTVEPRGIPRYGKRGRT